MRSMGTLRSLDSLGPAYRRVRCENAGWAPSFWSCWRPVEAAAIGLLASFSSIAECCLISVVSCDGRRLLEARRSS